MMESRGFATTAIGLVRYQMEQVRPPRGLWVPFELGRPLGEPEDAAFQTRVLMQALRLLERTDGPVILEDFADDPPGWTDRADWKAPWDEAAEVGGDPAEALAAEMARLRPAWDAAQHRFGRTTVGLSQLEPSAWPGFVGALLRGELPVVPQHGTAALSARFLCDDVKAMYSEAAQGVGPAPSSRQIEDWFWHRTAAGRLLIELRRVAMASGDNGLKTVGGRFFVRGPYIPVEDRSG